jgi:predicted ribosomally synthesized peptide with nif11-like leader
MSSVGKFYEKLAADPDLQKQLQAATAAAAEQAIVGIAGTQGFAFTVEELRSHVASQVEELSEEDLAKVAGGTGPGGLMPMRAASFMNQIGLMTGGGLMMGSGLMAGGGIVPEPGYAMNDRRCDSRCKCDLQ